MFHLKLTLMKKIILLFVTAFFGLFSFAQNGIGFQGIARDPQGNAIPNQTISVKFTIGTFTETQNIATDNFGVFSATIGSENPTDFNNLVFANSNDNLKVEVDGTTIYDDKFNTVPYAKAAENGVPPGSIMPFAGASNSIPQGWLLCDGSSYAKTGMYGALFNAIGTLWGDDGGNFKVPDLRGMFLRGTNEGRTDEYADPNNRVVGNIQADSYQNHNHTGTVTGEGTHNHYLGSRGFETNGARGADGSHDDGNISTNSGGGGHSHGVIINNSTSGSTETRPNNAAIIYIVKY